MAGERWLQLVDWIKGIDISVLNGAARDWYRVQMVLSTMALDLGGPMHRLVDAGVAGEVRDPLIRSAREMNATMQDVQENWGEDSSGSPTSAMQELEQQLKLIKSRILRDTSVPFAFPTDLSFDPDLRLLQEASLNAYDGVADDYSVEIHGHLLEAAYTPSYRPYWPKTAGPAGDPAADLSALGVPGPR